MVCRSCCIMRSVQQTELSCALAKFCIALLQVWEFRRVLASTWLVLLIMPHVAICTCIKIFFWMKFNNWLKFSGICRRCSERHKTTYTTKVNIESDVGEFIFCKLSMIKNWIAGFISLYNINLCICAPYIQCISTNTDHWFIISIDTDLIHFRRFFEACCTCTS